MEGERYCEGSNPRDKDMVKSVVLENVATSSPIMILPLVLCIKFGINYWLLTNKTFVLIAVSPLIWIPQQLVGAPLGTTVRLQCHIESSPRAISYWDDNLC